MIRLSILMITVAPEGHELLSLFLLPLLLLLTPEVNLEAHIAVAYSKVAAAGGGAGGGA